MVKSVPNIALYITSDFVFSVFKAQRTEVCGGEGGVGADIVVVVLLFSR